MLHHTLSSSSVLLHGRAFLAEVFEDCVLCTSGSSYTQQGWLVCGSVSWILGPGSVIPQSSPERAEMWEEGCTSHIARHSCQDSLMAFTTLLSPNLCTLFQKMQSESGSSTFPSDYLMVNCNCTCRKRKYSPVYKSASCVAEMTSC